MKFKDLNPSIIELAAPFVFYRVQLIRPRAKSVQLNGLSMPPVGLMYGRFCLPNEEIKALQARVEAARREVSKSQAGHLPTLDAIAQWSNSGSENITRINSRYENKTIGLQLNVPLFSGGYVNSTIRQAVAEQTRAEESLEALRRDLGERVHKNTAV
jgi:hypothetical protein